MNHIHLSFGHHTTNDLVSDCPVINSEYNDGNHASFAQLTI